MGKILRSMIPVSGEIGGPPYGVYQGSTVKPLLDVGSEELLRRMGGANQVLFENGDLIQGPLPKE